MFFKLLVPLPVFGFATFELFAKSGVEFISEVSAGSVPAFVLSVTEDEEVKVEPSEFKVSDIIENVDLFDKLEKREFLSVTKDAVLSCFKTAGRYLGKNFKGLSQITSLKSPVPIALIGESGIVALGY